MADREEPDRNLALELARGTEAAAMAAARWVGRGDKVGGDQVAVDAMRALLRTVGSGPECDVAVDPIDGTTLMSKGQPSAVAV